MQMRYLAMTAAGALILAAGSLPAAAGTVTPTNPEGGAKATVGPNAGRAQRNDATPADNAQGATTESTVPGSGNSFPPPQPDLNAGSISHPGKSLTNPEGGAPQTVGPNAGRAGREKSMGDFPKGAPK
jgi:hypothetical protein